MRKAEPNYRFLGQHISVSVCDLWHTARLMLYPARKMKPRLLTVRRAAEYLGVSIRTMRRLIADGRIPFVMMRCVRLVPFGRIYGLKPTKVYHTEMRIAQVDLGKIVFEGLPTARRKCQTKKYPNGKFAPRYAWPEIARKEKLTPLQRLIEDGIDLSKFL